MIFYYDINPLGWWFLSHNENLRLIKHARFWNTLLAFDFRALYPT
jgi:hypothetical protein